MCGASKRLRDAARLGTARCEASTMQGPFARRKTSRRDARGTFVRRRQNVTHDRKANARLEARKRLRASQVGRLAPATAQMTGDGGMFVTEHMAGISMRSPARNSAAHVPNGAVNPTRRPSARPFCRATMPPWECMDESFETSRRQAIATGGTIRSSKTPGPAGDEDVRSAADDRLDQAPGAGAEEEAATRAQEVAAPRADSRSH